ncbi:DUF4041 domain-containing protein [Limnohabitans sp.]|uniref:DUF4041 domain-containing protein n=1 Tax=Limnohabitans sp. TaxID=1907725 RepID=UPI00333EB612
MDWFVWFVWFVVAVAFWLLRQSYAKKVETQKQKNDELLASANAKFEAYSAEMQELLASVRVNLDAYVEKTERQLADLQTNNSAQQESLKRELSDAKAQVVRELVLRQNFSLEAERLKSEVASLARFRPILDAEAEADKLRSEAEVLKQKAIDEANEIKAQMSLEIRERRERIQSLHDQANQQATQIIATAKLRAEEVAGDAYRALKQVDQLQETATAIRNLIDGYGDRYLKPTFSWLDELAELYSFDDAGKELKLARERTQIMINSGRAATCDYVEQSRRNTAIRFVVDAFNGKVDSILSRTKSDNHGTLERQIRDACALVNNNGGAFRNARITEEFLQSRLDELRWAMAVIVLKEREREQQRSIRERMREEERARREIEKALKDIAKEEEYLQKAMEKIRLQVARASDEQKAQFEAELSSLQERLRLAEEKNQRALSMAQQTRAGHVYIISNVGSFGDGVYKVGMTRRLEPLDRVRELGDASVPFGFDVHAMIWSEDAPALEHALHKNFVRSQVNKVNPRKEFFRVGIAELRASIEARGLDVSWTMSADAAEYRESLAIEQRLITNPAMASDWLNKQEAFEIAEEMSLQSEELHAI